MGTTSLFFSQGIEHAVVNMVVIPVCMVMGTEVGMSHWSFLNKNPGMPCNLVGAMFFPGLAMFCAHRSPTIDLQQVGDLNHKSFSLSAQPSGSVCL